MSIPQIFGTRVEFNNKYVTLKTDLLHFERIEGDNIEEYNKEYYYLDCPDFVVGIVVKDDKILLVNQYRHPVGRINSEFVAGMIEEGETPEQAIRKELEEEAGIFANEIKYLGKCNPLSGQNNNICHIFLVEDFSEVSPKRELFEEFTGLSVCWLPIIEFRQLIKSNKFQDGVTLMAWGLYREIF